MLLLSYDDFKISQVITFLPHPSHLTVEHSLHSTDEEIEALRGEARCPRSWSEEVGVWIQIQTHGFEGSHFAPLPMAPVHTQHHILACGRCGVARLRPRAQACSLPSPRRRPGPPFHQLHPGAGFLWRGLNRELPIKFFISTDPSCDPEGKGALGEEVVKMWNLEMAISLKNKSVFLLQASQGPLVSSVTRQSTCCVSSDSTVIDNSIGPNYIMYVNFHLQISTVWTSLPTASHCPGVRLPGACPLLTLCPPREGPCGD